MTKLKAKSFQLRLLSVVVLFIMISSFVVTMIFVGNRLGFQNKPTASGGYLDLTEESNFDSIVYLNGEWETFDGIVCENNSDISNLGASTTYTNFPIGSLTESIRDASYRLYFALPPNTSDQLTIYVPNFYNSADYYLNGHKLNFVSQKPPWFSFSIMESVVLVEHLNMDDQWQELVITGSFSQTEMTLHKRPIVIGTINNVVATASFRSLNELFLFGIFLLTLISGYIFMLFRPTHKIISLMTIFDTFILLRTIFGMKYIFTFIKEIFPWFHISDIGSSTLSIFCLMIGGFVGCKLSAAIYDPDGKVPWWITKPVAWTYVIFAILFVVNPLLFEQYGRNILIVIYGITFVGVILQFRISTQNKQNIVYNYFQFIKTIFIGVVIFIDIYSWNSSNHQLFLFYLYALFFVLHVAVRLYDNNQSYVDVEKLNARLEDTVKTRTAELSTAIQVLSELSIRDSLTQIYNRLHFESEMEQCFESESSCESLYLCILDLDFFKRVNDTYGHNAGDDQLRNFVKIVSKKISDQIIFARLGGEEFVILYKNTDEKLVIDNLKVIRKAIEIDAKNNPSHTTASYGVARMEKGDNPKKLLKKADLALYEAKNQGRNCIVSNFDNTFTKYID